MGTKWLRTFFYFCFQGCERSNRLHKMSIITDDLVSAFSLIIDNSIINHKKVHRIRGRSNFGVWLDSVITGKTCIHCNFKCSWGLLGWKFEVELSVVSKVGFRFFLEKVLYPEIRSNKSYDLFVLTASLKVVRPCIYFSIFWI